MADSENHSTLTTVESWMQARLLHSVTTSDDEPISPEMLLKKIIEEILGQFQDSPIRILTPQEK